MGCLTRSRCGIVPHRVRRCGTVPIAFVVVPYSALHTQKRERRERVHDDSAFSHLRGLSSPSSSLLFLLHHRRLPLLLLLLLGAVDAEGLGFLETARSFDSIHGYFGYKILIHDGVFYPKLKYYLYRGNPIPGNSGVEFLILGGPHRNFDSLIASKHALYGLEARRIGMMSIPVIGCVPFQRTLGGDIQRG
ncbi:hypothetical protein DVH24_010697 [Malus domestica]|uniref:Uncharacterized protein n=1 Tax=Malus domestica TaxID=3750 RepID=A0A498JY15_MALDO|nr:hypothetical protein DVH24_010697 [Malus domestica]